MRVQIVAYMGGGGGGGMSDFDAVLFTHWRDDYTAILVELLDSRITQAAIEQELERVQRVAGAAFDADPFVTGTSADAVSSLQAYWSARLPAVQSELP